MNANLEQKIQQLSEGDRMLLVHRLKGVIGAGRSKASVGPKKIVAYIQPEDNFDLDGLKRYVKNKLPDFMVPSTFHIVDNIPFLPNGKVDKNALKGIAAKQADSETTFTEPSSEVEQQLVSIWEEVLNFSPISVNDNFFEIGGDSILSIQIVAKARQAGIELTTNQLFENQTIKELCVFVSKGTDSDIEGKLITIWEEVLDVKPIRKDDNFFEVGGDSILSIQIIAKARKQGIKISPTQFFEYQTIRELVLFISKNDGLESGFSKEMIGEIPMTPIQHWFFDTHKNAPSYWNQGLRMNNVSLLKSETFSKIIKILVNRHSALRLNFKSDDNDQWIAELCESDKINAFQYHDLSKVESSKVNEKIEEILDQFNSTLDISSGSIFKALYFHLGTETSNSIVFVAHHLIVDAVSWQILINDFKHLLAQNAENGTLGIKGNTVGIEVVTARLEKLAFSNELIGQVDFWKEQSFGRKQLPTDIDFTLPLLEKNIATLELELDVATTDLLLTKANIPFNTKTEELLILALVDVICNWANSEYLYFGMERHGRDMQNDEALELSSTVGWLTAYFPVKIKNHQAELGSKIKLIKEDLRKIVDSGANYGILKYLNKTVEVDSVSNYSPEIVFNFLGRQTGNPKDTASTEFLTKGFRSLMSERNYLFEINSFVMNNKLLINWEYSLDAYKSETVQSLLNDYEQKLKQLITFCTNSDEVQYTPSDFPEVQMDQDDLDDLINSLE